MPTPEEIAEILRKREEIQRSFAPQAVDPAVAEAQAIANQAQGSGNVLQAGSNFGAALAGIAPSTSQAAGVAQGQERAAMADLLQKRKDAQARAMKQESIRTALTDKMLLPGAGKSPKMISGTYGEQDGRKISIQRGADGGLQDLQGNPYTGNTFNAAGEQIAEKGKGRIAADKRSATNLGQRKIVHKDKMTKEVRDIVKNHAKDFDSRVKNLEKGIVSANILSDTLRENPRQAMSVIKTQMPRLAGEVGNLSETEQLAWAGDPSVLEMIKRFGNAQLMAEHVLTDTDVEELSKVLDILAKNRQKVYGTIRERYTTRARQDTPDDQHDRLEEYFGRPLEYKGVGKKDKKKKSTGLTSVTDEDLDNMSTEELEKMNAEN